MVFMWEDVRTLRSSYVDIPRELKTVKEVQ